MKRTCQYIDSTENAKSPLTPLFQKGGERGKSPLIPLFQRGKRDTGEKSPLYPPLEKGGRGDFQAQAPFAAVRYLKTLFSLRTYFYHQRNDLFEKKLDVVENGDFQAHLFNDFSLTIVETPEQLAALLSEGRDVSSCDFLNYAGAGIRKGAVLFFLFKGAELAHASWVSMNDRAAFLDPIFEKLRFDDAGCIGPCCTNPVYRGRGCYPYVLNRICAFLKEKGKSRALINTKRLNRSSVRGIEKAGFQIVAEVFFLKVLIWKLCRMKGVSYAAPV